MSKDTKYYFDSSGQVHEGPNSDNPLAPVPDSFTLNDALDPSNPKSQNWVRVLKDNAASTPGAVPILLSLLDKPFSSSDEFLDAYYNRLAAFNEAYNNAHRILGSLPENGTYVSPAYFFKTISSNLKGNYDTAVKRFSKHSHDMRNSFLRGNVKKGFSDMGKMLLTNPITYPPYYALFKHPVTLPAQPSETNGGLVAKPTHDHPEGIFSPYLSIFTEGKLEYDPAIQESLLNSSLASYIWEGIGDLWEEGINRLVSTANPFSVKPVGATADHLAALLSKPDFTTRDARELQRLLYYGSSFDGETKRSIGPASSLGYEALRKISNVNVPPYYFSKAVTDPVDYFNSLAYHALDFGTFIGSSDFPYMAAVGKAAHWPYSKFVKPSVSKHVDRLNKEFRSLAASGKKKGISAASKIFRSLPEGTFSDSFSEGIVADEANKAFKDAVLDTVSKGTEKVAGRPSLSRYLKKKNLVQDLLKPGEITEAGGAHDAFGGGLSGSGHFGFGPGVKEAVDPSFKHIPWYAVERNPLWEYPAWLFAAPPVIGTMVSLVNSAMNPRPPYDPDAALAENPPEQPPPSAESLREIVKSPRFNGTVHDFRPNFMRWYEAANRPIYKNRFSSDYLKYFKPFDQNEE